MKIAVSQQTTLFALTLLLAGLSGCQKDQRPPQKTDVASLNSHSQTAKKAAKIIVPPSVAGRWKAVRISVIDKSNVSQKVYTIPVGGNLDIPASAVNITVETFLPSFVMEGSTMTSASNDLTNPGVKVQITENGAVIFKGWLFSKFPNTHAFMHPKYGFTLVDFVPAAR